MEDEAQFGNTFGISTQATIKYEFKKKIVYEKEELVSLIQNTTECKYKV